MNRTAIAAAAPTAPPCFADRGSWVEYLDSAQEGKQQPFRSGKFQINFNFCNDCTLEHAARMERAGLCNPTVFLAKAPAEPTKEAAHGC